MQHSAYTDLAYEARQTYLRGRSNTDIPGVEVESEQIQNVSVTRVKIINENGAETLGKPMGSYITLETQMIPPTPEQSREVSIALANELKPFCDGKRSALIIGLGNRYVTPDALGPRVVEHTLVTRHLIENLPDQIDERVRPVAAIAPGVLGLTGIETLEVVKGITTHVKPDVIIAIDALASSSAEHLANTVQLSDTGVSPGSGMGNQRKSINEATLGIPVIAVGVPLVVYAQTIVEGVLDEMSAIFRQSSRHSLTHPENGNIDFSQIANNVIKQTIGELVVTPKEIDQILNELSSIIAMGINLSLHDNIEYDEMLGLMD